MDAKAVAGLLLPLLLIPLTLYAVAQFGEVAGNIVIGAAFVVGLVKFAKGKEKRFMLILAIFAMIFESINIISGSYRYAGSDLTPLWIGMGWGLVGLYVVRNAPRVAERIGDMAAYALAVILYASTLAITGLQPPAIVAAAFAVAAVYVLRDASGLPAAFFLFAGATGVLIEFCGPYAGVWSYLDRAGAVMPPPLASMGFAYMAVIAFGMWLSGLERK